MDRIAVIYLARYAEGVEPVKKFITSYTANSAAVDHDLIIVWKGFPNNSPAGSEQLRFCDESLVRYQSICVSDFGLDLTAYEFAARSIDHDYVCFLNTFSQIRSFGWLRKFYGHARRPDVGIVGATGSYESINLSMKAMCCVAWLCAHNIPYDPFFAEAYPTQIEEQAPGWLARSTVRSARSPLPKHLLAQFEEEWRAGPIEYSWLPAFPNPHLRSNAFMIKRSLFVSIIPPRISTKLEAFRAESGSRSISKKVLDLGLETLVVGADGLAYAQDQWKRSGTFRIGNQSNLMVSDNQTERYRTGKQVEREVITSLTWGPAHEMLPVRSAEQVTLENMKVPSGPYAPMANPHLPLPFTAEMFL